MHTDPEIWFLGPVGTHSHEACRRAFPAGFVPHPARTVREVLETVAAAPAGAPALAVVPVENSIEGPVTQTLDWLAEMPALNVRAALRMAIHHDLLVKPGTAMNDVRAVHSHPQALAQCAEWLRRHLGNAEPLPATSTAEAARRAAAEDGAAAIAGTAAGKLHGLVPLARNIEDDPQNETRFLVIEPRAGAHTDAFAVAGAVEGIRALLQLDLPNVPGSLLRALEPFNAQGLNLSFIQSRPRRGRPWEYRFFVEVDRRPGPEPLDRVIRSLADRCERVRELGAYPDVRLEEPAS